MKGHRQFQTLGIRGAQPSQRRVNGVRRLDPSERRQAFGPILPMVQPSWFARLVGKG